MKVKFKSKEEILKIYKFATYDGDFRTSRHNIEVKFDTNIWYIVIKNSFDYKKKEVYYLENDPTIGWYADNFITEKEIHDQNFNIKLDEEINIK